MFNSKKIEALNNSIALLDQENAVLRNKMRTACYEIEMLKGQVASNQYDFSMFAKELGYKRTEAYTTPSGWKKIEAS